LGTGFGGLSGPAIKPLIVRKVFQVAQRLQQVGKEVPLIGVGGIWSGSDVAEYLAAGAIAVQLGTVLFADPLAPQRILREFTALLERLDLHGFIGSAHKAPSLSPR
jgi:dihydroorotate dehydrogenase (NAD+) catalytic subunit